MPAAADSWISALITSLLRDLSQALLLLRHLQEARGLPRALLRGRVLSLRDNQRVVVRVTVTARPRCAISSLAGGYRLRGRARARAAFPSARSARISCLHHAPRTVHVDAVHRDEAAVRIHAVRLVAEILRGRKLNAGSRPGLAPARDPRARSAASATPTGTGRRSAARVAARPAA